MIKPYVEDYDDNGEHASTIEVEWTGKYPCLCYGEWVIRINGDKVALPNDVAFNPMDTFGEYATWHFADDWSEEWEYYEDGLTFEPWLKANTEWVAPLGLSEEDVHRLYEMIHSCDWRHNSCGGCI